MKYYFNKAKPDIEYGMDSQRKINSKNRKPDKDGLVKYYYVSAYNKIFPVKVTPEVYAELIEADRWEYNNNNKHDRRYIDVYQYFKQRGEIDEDDTATDAWECVAYERSHDFANKLCAEMDRKAVMAEFDRTDRKIYDFYKNGYTQKEIAEMVERSQSYVSKRLFKITNKIEFERLNDGSRKPREICFELAWNKFFYSQRMPRDIDVVLETFNYMIGNEFLEELLIWFFSFREYYHYAYKILYLFEYDKNKDVLGLINDLAYRYRAIFYERGLDGEADIFI